MKKILAALVLLALLVACSPKKGESGPKDQKIKIGILQLVDHQALNQARDGFKEVLDLSDLDVDFEEVNAQGDQATAFQGAKSLFSKNPDLVYAIATPAAQNALQARGDQNTPLLFNAVTDPIEAGLVDKLEGPTGNVTGVSDAFPTKKQVESFLTCFPEIKTLGVLYSTDEANSSVQIKALEDACKDLGLKLEKVGISSINDVKPAMTSLLGKIDGYFCITDNLAASSAYLIGDLLKEAKIPSFGAERAHVDQGLLMSEGIDYTELGRQAGRQALEILQDKKSLDEIPVFFTEKTSKVVNEDTLKALNVNEDQAFFNEAEKVSGVEN